MHSAYKQQSLSAGTSNS